MSPVFVLCVELPAAGAGSDSGVCDQHDDRAGDVRGLSEGQEDPPKPHGSV